MQSISIPFHVSYVGIFVWMVLQNCICSEETINLKEQLVIAEHRIMVNLCYIDAEILSKNSIGYKLFNPKTQATPKTKSSFLILVLQALLAHVVVD